MQKQVILLFAFLSLSYSCKKDTDYSNRLEYALTFANENRIELEKVLQHYSIDKKDSLKLEAAKFLIVNMPGHYSYKNTDRLDLYYNEIDTAVSLDKENEINKKIMESISTKYERNDTKKFVYDIQVITADYLINNIERAFEAWEQGEWATHVSFDDFCEYILPYKGAELQKLDNWREYSKDMFKADIDDLHYCDLYKNSTFRAATAISKEIIKFPDFCHWIKCSSASSANFNS